MHMLGRFSCLVLFLCCVPFLHGQEEEDNPFLPKPEGKPKAAAMGSVKVSAKVEPQTVRRGGTVTVKVTLEPDKGYWTYPPKQIPQAKPGDEILVTTLGVDEEGIASLAGPTTGSPPKVKEYKKEGRAYGIYDAPAVLEQKLLIKPTAPVGKQEIKLSVQGTVCNDDKCFPVSETVTLPLEISNEAALDAPPEEPRLKVTAAVDSPAARRGGTVTVKVTLTPRQGFHTYPPEQPPQASDKARRMVTKIEPTETDQFVAVGVAAGPPAKLKQDKELHLNYAVYYEPAVLEQKIRVKPSLAPGQQQLKIKVLSQVCDKSRCWPVAETLTVPVTITDEPPLEEEPKIAEAPTDTSNEDLLTFMLAGAGIGFITLLTPCVFPMIPITVSYFLKQSEQEHHSPLAMASVYAATIVAVLTIAAVTLLKSFQELIQMSGTNFVLGGLFIFFALSLFGLYEIRLPSSLAQYTSAQEGKGGYVGTIFMAFTFTIISFSCVAPFLGGFAGTATQQRPFLHTVLGGLSFSITFAAPFFLLALFPGLLKKMPKSGNWLNSVKVVMGFIELAAALKFLRAGELRIMAGEPTAIFTFDLVLSAWVAMCVACGLYLFNLFRVSHDTPEEEVGVIRLLFGVLFLSLAVYMAPALLKAPNGKNQRMQGSVYSWINSFLLPEPGRKGETNGVPTGTPGNPSPSNELVWSENLDATLKAARERKELVFIDFTGDQCTNCKFNEESIFPEPRVNNLLRKYMLVQLCTDRGTKETNANKDFEQKHFNTIELPLYVVLEPLEDGSFKVHGKTGGKINSVENFAEFLEKPLREKGKLSEVKAEKPKAE
jgi:thiol:disulfide interchange protein